MFRHDVELVLERFEAGSTGKTTEVRRLHHGKLEEVLLCQLKVHNLVNRLHVQAEIISIHDTSAALKANEILFRCVFTTTLMFEHGVVSVEVPQHGDVEVDLRFLAAMNLVDVNFVIHLLHGILQSTEMTDACLRLDLGQVAEVL